MGQLEFNNRKPLPLVQIDLQYTLPRMKQETDEVKDLPLFIN